MSQADSPTPPAPKSKKKRTERTRRQRWLRRLKITFFIVFGTLVTFRAAMPIILPIVIRHTAARYGLVASYERLELDLYGGDVGLWHLKLLDHKTAEPVIELDYIRGDISTLNLLRGRLVVWRAEAEGTTLDFVRKPDGKIPLLERFASAASSATTSAPAPAPAASTARQEIDLTSPLVLGTLRINRVRLHLRDETVQPAADMTVETSIWLTDLKSPNRPTRLEFSLSANHVLDSLRIEGEATSHGKQNLDAQVRLSLRGLHLKQIAEYLRALGLHPTADSLSGDMRMRIVTSPSTQPGCLAASLKCDKIEFAADGKDFASLDNMSIDAGALGPGVMQIAKIVIDGVHAHAARNPNGNLDIAGIELLPASAAPPKAPRPQTSSFPLQWSIGEVDLHHLEASLRDSSVTPAADIPLSITDLQFKNINDKNPAAATTLTARLDAPGTLGQIVLIGSALPFTSAPCADLNVNIEGISLEAMRPYFTAMGLECDLNNASLICALHADRTRNAAGKPAMDLLLNKILLKSQSDLFDLKSIRIAGLGYDAAGRIYRIDDIEISGPSLEARRNKSGSLSALGFTTIGHAKTKKAAVATPEPPPARAVGAAATQPSLEIGKFVWKDVDFQFEDQCTSPATKFDVKDAGIEFSDLLLDINPHPAAAAKESHIRAWLKVPGIIGDFQLEGIISPGPNGSEAALDINASGLHTAALIPYLRSSGIEPILSDGTFHARANFSLNEDAGILRASGEITDIKLMDQKRDLLSVVRVKLSAMELGDAKTDLGCIRIYDPVFSVTRQRDGSMVLPGVHLIAATQPAEKTPVAQNVASTQPSAPSAPPQVLSLQSLNVFDALVHWNDQTLAEPINVDVHVNVSVNGLDLSQAPPPATFGMTLSVDKCVDKLDLDGDFTPSPQSPDVHLKVTASGLRFGELAEYLSPNLHEATAIDGRFRATLDAGLRPNPQGGTQAHLVLSNVEYRNGAGGPVMLKLDSLRVMLGRIDPSQRIFAADEISLSGLEAELHKTAKGWRILGLEMRPSTAAPVVKVIDAPVPTVAAARSGPSTQPAELSKLIAQRKLKLPLITLQKLDLQTGRLSLIDDTRPGSAPLAISDLHLISHGPIELLGDRPEERPPIDLELICHPVAMASELTARVKAAPFAIQPHVSVDVMAAGIKGNAILDSRPELRQSLDGGELTDGRFTAQLSATITRIDRQGLLRFQLDRPFDAEMDIKAVHWQNGAARPLLAGIGEIRADGVHVDPAAGNVEAKSLEISNLTGRIERKSDGIHAMGFVLKTRPSDIPQTPPPSPSAALPVEQQTPSQAAAAMPSSAIVIDKLTISGMDFVLSDQCVDPQFVFPITGFDLEARGLSTRMLYEERYLHFSLLANAGKVSLPHAPPATAPATQAAATQQAVPVEIEQRDLFSQITASGNLALYPRPKGWIKTSLSGMELVALKGEAKNAGYDLSGGTVDVDVDGDFPGDGSADFSTHTVLDDPAITDTGGGFARLFGAPLDATLYALEDASGHIDFPVTIPVRNGQLDTRTVISSAIGAVSVQIAKAVLSAPIKVMKGVGSMMGIDFGSSKESPLPPSTITFAPGDATVISFDRPALQKLIERTMMDDKSQIVLREELSAGDAEREKLLANPPPKQIAALAGQWRERKTQLLKSRAIVDGQVRARLASGQSAEMSIQRLRAIDRDIAHTEDALDEFYNLLRPGADRGAARRTRAACLSLAQNRLQAVRQTILDMAGRDLDPERINVISASYNPSDSPAGGSVVAASSKKK